MRQFESSERFRDHSPGGDASHASPENAACASMRPSDCRACDDGWSKQNFLRARQTVHRPRVLHARMEVRRQQFALSAHPARSSPLAAGSVPGRPPRRGEGLPGGAGESLQLQRRPALLDYVEGGALQPFPTEIPVPRMAMAAYPPGVGHATGTGASPFPGRAKNLRRLRPDVMVGNDRVTEDTGRSGAGW